MTMKRTVSLWFALIVQVAVVVSFVGVGWVVKDSEDREDKQDRQAVVDGQYLSCLRGNELRQLMERQTELAYDGGGGLALSALPSFDNVPDSVQRWVTDLEEQSRLTARRRADDPQSVRNRILVEIRSQVRDCDAEYPDHTPGLGLPHDG